MTNGRSACSILRVARKGKPVKYDDVYGWNGKTVNKVWLSD
jgi:hypothetical protein